jgi:RNA polymerase sigma-70 factor (ECF subfamily)
MEPLRNELVTDLLLRWRAGDRQCLDRLVPLVEDELRRIARGCMQKERRGHTLQTTALVNEAYLRLVQQRQVDCQSRARFLGIAARLMRQILVDRARKFRSKKRGGGELLPLDEGLVFSPVKSASLVALDDALHQLAGFDARKAQIVELRYFGGLTVEETAEALAVRPKTVCANGAWPRPGSSANSARGMPMQAELWKKVEALDQAALAQPVEQRAMFLMRACPDDPQLRREVSRCWISRRIPSWKIRP